METKASYPIAERLVTSRFTYGPDAGVLYAEGCTLL
jgi:hypothetical protein